MHVVADILTHTMQNLKNKEMDAWNYEKMGVQRDAVMHGLSDI